MNAVVRATVGALGLAGDFVSVPGLGAGASLAEAIQNECEKVATHKVGIPALHNT